MGMPEVFQSKPLSMGWCLACHRDPSKHIVPPDQVTKLTWVEQELSDRAEGRSGVDVDALLGSLRRDPPQYCGACHH